MMNRNALVIMARSPEAGDVKTRLAPALGAGERRKLYTKLLDDTVSRLSDVAGVDTLIAYTPADSGEFFVKRYVLPSFPQAEGDLGSKTAGIFERLLKEHCDKVVVVGSDIPALSITIVSRAFKSLDASDMVIGPASDGGYYLIGLKEPSQNLFQDIPWSTDQVLKETLLRAREAGLSTKVIDILDDIDTPDDLKRLGLL